MKELKVFVGRVVTGSLPYINLDEENWRWVLRDKGKEQICEYLTYNISDIVRRDGRQFRTVKKSAFMENLLGVKHPLKGIVVELVLEAVKRGVRTDLEARKLLVSGEGLRLIIIQCLINISLEDPEDYFISRIQLTEITTITLPHDYDHGTQLKRAKKYRGEFRLRCKEELFNDEDLCHLSEPLSPGKTYLVKIFRMRTLISDQEVRQLLQTNRAIKAGAQGLSIFFRLRPVFFRLGAFMMSYDMKKVSDQEGDNWMTALYRENPRDSQEFWKIGYQDGLGKDFSLLCICDPPLGKNI